MELVASRLPLHWRCGDGPCACMSATRIRTVGAGIYVWDNGLEALDTIGAAAEGLDDAYEAPAITVRASDGRPLYRIDVNQPGGARCVTLLRDRLIGALHVAAEHAGVEVCTGSAAVSATADGTVEFSTGTSTRADLVVAADGVHSLLRDRLGISYRRIRMRQGAARVMVSGRGHSSQGWTSINITSS